jgi:hypothetical protein
LTKILAGRNIVTAFEGAGFMPEKAGKDSRGSMRNNSFFCTKKSLQTGKISCSNGSVPH